MLRPLRRRHPRPSRIGEHVRASFLPLGLVILSQEPIVHDRSTPLALGLAAALTLAACSGGDSASKRPDTVGAKGSATAETPPPCTTGTAELTLPAGFCATIFADSITHARHVAVA